MSRFIRRSAQALLLFLVCTPSPTQARALLWYDDGQGRPVPFPEAPPRSQARPAPEPAKAAASKRPVQRAKQVTAAPALGKVQPRQRGEAEVASTSKQ